MSRRPVLEVEMGERSYDWLVRFYDRDWLARTIGRTPVWVSLRRGYSVSETTARNVVAAAEHAGLDVVITGPRARTRGPASPTTSDAPDDLVPIDTRSEEPALW